MQITIPEEVARALGGDEGAVLEEIVVSLYKMKRLTLAMSARLLGIDRISFQRILGKKGQYLNYSMAEVEEDLRAADFVAQSLSKR